jgi:ATP-dependent DNA helicase RecQ
MPSPASILKETFGYNTFRPLQSEVIENVLARRDTLAVMPTGGGKSLCYQIPSRFFFGLTVVF